MLSVQKEFQRFGLGSKLMLAAENLAKSKGCNLIKLEIFAPRDWEHPLKGILHDWYTKLGYKQGEAKDFAGLYPEEAHLLSCPCKLTEYEKEI